MSSDGTIIGYCRMCGKALQESDAIATEGTLYCAEHAPHVHASSETAAALADGHEPPPLYTPPVYHASTPYTPGPPPLPKADHHVSPPLAFALGFIPGVGAVYNGQYAKGLLHVVIFGSIISILSSGAAQGFEPLFGLMIPTFVFYMAFEAYHTAKKRRDGEMVDEFSGLARSRGERSRFPMAPVLLIVFGILFLLDNLDLLKIGRLLRYWPALLIVLGLYLLYERIAESNMNPSNNPSTPGNNPALLRSIRGPVMLVTLGTLFMIDHSGGASFHRTWPVLLIVLGVLWLGEHLGTKNA